MWEIFYRPHIFNQYLDSNRVVDIYKVIEEAYVEGYTDGKSRSKEEEKRICDWCDKPARYQLMIHDMLGRRGRDDDDELVISLCVEDFSSYLRSHHVMVMQER